MANVSPKDEPRGPERTTEPRPSAVQRAGLRWLTQLRWASLGGQLLTIVIVRLASELPLELGLLLGLVGLGAASNLGLALWIGRARGEGEARALIAAVLGLDVALLTALLLAAGGPANPFSIFYLVHVVLAGLLLGARGAWWMALATAVAFGLLFVLPAIPIDEHAMHHHGASSLHLQGMWVAFALAAAFVAAFVSGLARALARRDEELARLGIRAERSERLAALATFSASAAHELGSPLATIAVSARELERALEREGAAAGDLKVLADDARLIRAEVDRCRGMLNDLSRRGGLLHGERVEPIASATLWGEVRERFANRPGLALTAPEGPTVELVVPRVALVQALCNLVDNADRAQRASADPARRATPIAIGTRLVTGRGGGDEVRLWVRDRGAGFQPEVLRELGEAFVTTRPGEGLGLGLHLAQTLAHALGGRLDVVSSADGSEVALVLPRDTVGAADRAHEAGRAA